MYFLLCNAVLFQALYLIETDRWTGGWKLPNVVSLCYAVTIGVHALLPIWALYRLFLVIEEAADRPKIKATGTTVHAGKCTLSCFGWTKVPRKLSVPDIGTKPEVTKPKLWWDYEAEAEAEALTFWNHKAEAEAEALRFLNHEAEAEAQVFGSYKKGQCFTLLTWYSLKFRQTLLGKMV